MGKAVYTTVDFEVNPTISDRVKKFVFINEVLRYAMSDEIGRASLIAYYVCDE